jgi:nucleotide-binding universal stress UspA family protein
VSTPFVDITVPVDESATARRGIDYAIQLAAGGARLHFCSVVNMTGALISSAMAAPIDPAALIAGLKDEAGRAARHAVAAAHARGIVADGKVIYGAIAPAIAQYTLETRSDSLVIATHARRGLARIVFGSVAESLLAISRVPVVIAHADDLEQTTGPVTVAVDDSLAARGALTVAIDLARTWNAPLSIVSAAEPGREQWREAGLLLDEAAESARAAGIDFELVTTVGHAAEEVVDGAQRRSSSMIVVGTDVRSSAARFVLGSVAATILERARVPVTVVPHHSARITQARADESVEARL